MKTTRVIAIAAAMTIMVLMAIDQTITDNSTPAELTTGDTCYEVDGNIFCPARRGEV